LLVWSIRGIKVWEAEKKGNEEEKILSKKRRYYGLNFGDETE